MEMAGQAKIGGKRRQLGNSKAIKSKPWAHTAAQQRWEVSAKMTGLDPWYG